MPKILYFRIPMIALLVLIDALHGSGQSVADEKDKHTEGQFIGNSPAELNSSEAASHDLSFLSQYRIFDSAGRPASLDLLIDEVRESDVAFLGEIHTDIVAHYLELLILKLAWDENQSLSLEMFESDVQYVVDEYLAGLISEEHFIKSARSWDNYSSDYRALLEFSKEKGMPVVAANAPRRYVNMVRRSGKESLSSLSKEAKQFLPPIPYPEPSQDYENKFRAIMSAHQSIIQQVSSSQEEIDSHDNDTELDQVKSEAEQPHGMDEVAFQKMLAAQNLWDASMAWSIASHLKSNPSNRVIHVNGSFHTDYSIGIPGHLESYLSNIKMLTVTIVPSFDYPNFSNSMRGLGDFIIVTDGSLPPSH